MYSLQPTLRLGRDVWDRAAMPVEEFRERADRLRASMRSASLDALLLYGSGLNDCGHPTYVSNYVVKLPFAALVMLPRDGEAALMFEGATRGRSAAQATTWIDDVRPCWNMAETCLAVLAERKLLTATIGVAAMPRLVPHGQWTTLTAGLRSATIVDAEDLVDAQRTIKSSRERALVRRASGLVSRATDEYPLVDEADLAALAMRTARLQGAEDIRLLIARTQDRGWRFRPPEPGRIRDGELIALAVSASWERYWAEATRTFVARRERLIPASDERIDARLRTILTCVRPGITIAECVRAMDSMMTPEERSAIEPYGLGHGIGITPEEPPVFKGDNLTTLRSGMCLVVRTAVSTAEGMVLQSDTVVI